MRADDHPRPSRAQRAKEAGLTRNPSEVSFLVESMQSSELSQGMRLWMVAAAALAHYGVDTVLQAGSELGHDSPPSARAAYAYALGKTRDASALPELALLAQDSDPDVVLWAALALAQSGNEAVAVLAENLEGSRDLSRKLIFADALNKIPTLEARTSLRTILEAMAPDDRQEIRTKIAEIDESSTL